MPSTCLWTSHRGEALGEPVEGRWGSKKGQLVTPRGTAVQAARAPSVSSVFMSRPTRQGSFVEGARKTAGQGCVCVQAHVCQPVHTQAPACSQGRQDARRAARSEFRCKTQLFCDDDDEDEDTAAANTYWALSSGPLSYLHTRTLSCRLSPGERHHYCPHFTDEQREAPGGKGTAQGPTASKQQLICEPWSAWSYPQCLLPLCNERVPKGWWGRR